MVTLSGLVLLFCSFVFYCSGALFGYYSNGWFVVLAIVYLAQIFASAVKKSKPAGLLTSFGMTFWLLWWIATAAHKMFLGAGPLKNVFPFLPLFLVFLLITWLNSKGKIRITGMDLKEAFRFDMTTTQKQTDGMQHPGLRICKNEKTGRDVVIPGNDRYLHMLVIGPTGGGKTALSFRPYVYQDIEFIAKGNNARIIIIEPDGSFTRSIRDYCESLNVPVEFLDVTNPIEGLHLNPLEGPRRAVTNSLTTVLTADNDHPYFSVVQKSACQSVCQLLKFLHDDDLDIQMVTNVLRNMVLLESKVKQLEDKLKAREFSKVDENSAQNVLDSLRPRLLNDHTKEKFLQDCSGLIEKLNNLTGDPNIQQIMCGKSTFSFDEIYDTPGVLLINTGNDSAGDMFGKFVLLSMQSATLRRPGDENTRPPVYTYIDEFARYATPEYKEVFTQGRKYRNSHIIAIQSFSQLKLNDTYKDTISTNTRNKVVLTGLSRNDAYEASLEMGEKEEIDKSTSYGDGGFIGLGEDNKRYNERRIFRPRFSVDDLMHMDRNSIVYKIVVDRQPLQADRGIVAFATEKTLEQIVGKRVVHKKPVFKKPTLPKIIFSLPTFGIEEATVEKASAQDSSDDPEQLSPYERRLLEQLDRDRQMRNRGEM